MFKNPNPINEWKPKDIVYFWDTRGMDLHHGTIIIILPSDTNTCLRIKTPASKDLLSVDPAYCFTDAKSASDARMGAIITLSNTIAGKLTTAVDLLIACCELANSKVFETPEEIAKNIAIQKRAKELFGIERGEYK